MSFLREILIQVTWLRDIDVDCVDRFHTVASSNRRFNTQGRSESLVSSTSLTRAAAHDTFLSIEQQHYRDATIASTLAPTVRQIHPIIAYHPVHIL